ncbi:hypothetical protein [Cloacibacillus porcorum]|uniref:hypothetical protein n=1 Tax=Cloacibacillus porcorum TaxID=1197717 RepID=UPI0026730730|nr:hypothetical protein [Cloacibacillus porcorum]
MPEILEAKDGGVVEKSLVMRLIILDYYDTEAEMRAAHPTGADGDCYKIGDNLYLWGPSTNSWVDIGRLKGDIGPSGESATIAIGTVTTGAAGSAASVENAGTPSAALLNFHIPKGETGAPGPDGASATIQVGSVTTGAAGTNASVTNAGTTNAAVLNFTIPRGEKGENGLSALPGAVIPFYNVTFSGRHPIFWGKTAADAGWVICDGGDDLNGGTVPNLSDRFILGTTDAATAKETGGANTTGNTTTGGTVANNVAGGTVGATTLSQAQMPSHGHTYKDYYGYSGGDLLTYGRGGGETAWYAPARTGTSNAAGGSGSHTHGFTGASHGHTFTGSAHNHSVTPPYYKLVYCVKLPG